MKKLKMIVTSVVVLAIVGSAFAFKVKRGNFCITTTLASTQCTIIVDDFKTTTDTEVNQVKYFPNWLGVPTDCSGTNTNCTGTIRLTGN
jgi:hypothetical protein